MVIDAHSIPGHYLLSAPFVLLGFPNFGWIGVDIFRSQRLPGGWAAGEGVEGLRSYRSQEISDSAWAKIWPQYHVFILLGLITGHRKLSESWEIFSICKTMWAA
jgi:hypothetical protein